MLKRALNNDLLDTYQLKSLDGFLELDLNKINITKINNKYYLSVMDIDGKHQNQINNLGYDFVIRCMGFKFDFDLFQKFVYFNTEREFES